MTDRRWIVLSLLLVLGPASAAAAQQPTDERPVVAVGQDGLAVQSATGDFRVQFGLLLHADGRFSLDDSEGRVADTFAIRRARPYVRGRLSRRFEFYLNPDFAGGTLVLQDAYLDTIFSPAFRVRVGKAKTPFGLERLHAASNLLFFNRALPTALVPNRDVGVQALGDLGGGLVSYAVALMNGVPDGGSGDVDTGDAKDLSGRVVVRPFRAGTTSLKGLGLALAGSTGRQSGSAALPVLRTASLEQPFLSYAGAVADGRRTRVSPQAFYYYKGFGGFAEYVQSTAPLRRAAIREELAQRAWQVAASYVLTGEAATDAGAGVRPRANVDFANGGLGAFQVAARYHRLRVDSEAVTLGLAAPGANPSADAWTLGLNWYLTGNLRNTFNFERTTFGRGEESRTAENAFDFRTQVNF